MREAFAPMVLTGEDVADAGDALLLRHDVDSGYGDKFALAADSAEESGVELEGSEGDSRAGAGCIEALDFGGVFGAEDFRVAGAFAEIIDDHAAHAVGLFVLIEVLWRVLVTQVQVAFADGD